ncbi:MAG: hypothetical protein LBQ43_03230 [Holosporales bacterium]|jgi:hypothetical protein|nr:hypothetical protein [Holosporales bacterium]
MKNITKVLLFAIGSVFVCNPYSFCSDNIDWSEENINKWDTQGSLLAISGYFAGVTFEDLAVTISSADERGWTFTADECRSHCARLFQYLAGGSSSENDVDVLGLFLLDDTLAVNDISASDKLYFWTRLWSMIADRSIIGVYLRAASSAGESVTEEQAINHINSILERFQLGGLLSHDLTPRGPIVVNGQTIRELTPIP